MKTLLLTVTALLTTVTGQYSDRIIFPTTLELGLGDPCVILPRAGNNIAIKGTCTRITECQSFIPRLLQGQVDTFREICYFEVQDPVVCCVHRSSKAFVAPLPNDSSVNGWKGVRAVPDFDNYL